ncbi:efflux RND transporter periplasmic adaptor subunit [Pedobacter caeni]|uniref:Membrane fusion protein, cobalt-zinc-cadmium efflux system n=1 Tax=Pedobacter caeni TaxID=288992 RepID=A0A1M5HM66_9SPHI|nr:efflux RND transporter periplasmic adaptor subunit [Pedobacter caeni]SHG17035.1 membrane fusion protein, cobalt-zinc-cadmium efflux system [Pedobacter caeni]
MQTLLKNIYALSLIGLVITSQSCTSSKEAPVADKFAVTDSLINRLLIDTVQQANNRTDLSFSAKITADEERKAEIFPMVSGTVRNVPVKLGDKVSAGQVLATMGSAEMAGFDKEVISSGAELRNAQRHVTQLQELYKSGLSSARELEEAKNDLLIKQAEDKRARATLKLNGGNNNGNYTIKSPLTGFIIEKNVTSNMQLRPDNNKNVFTVADLSSVWAMINIYESDISRIKEGDEVNISILSYPEKTFKGKIDKMYNMIDSESKVMNARVTIANPGYLLKPGMMATVLVSATSGMNLPIVKSRGIIFDENKNYALVVDAAKKVRIQEIEVARKTGDKAYISKGLNAGDRIVASKQVFLYESLKN